MNGNLSLQRANEQVAGLAIVSERYIPLSHDCHVYGFVVTHYDVRNTTMCFASTFIQRYLHRQFPGFDAWFDSTNDSFRAQPPENETQVILLLRYLTCVSLAYKFYGDEEEFFSLKKACNSLLYRFPTAGDLFSMEAEVLECLDFRLGPAL
jgi:hypothetical protein